MDSEPEHLNADDEPAWLDRTDNKLLQFNLRSCPTRKENKTTVPQQTGGESEA